MNQPVAVLTRENLDRILSELRPRLHRYCARMTGSVIDGEDIVQEALIKAIEAFPREGTISNAEGWLIRIAHNTALDYLRRRVRLDALHSDEDLAMTADPVSTADERLAVAASLRTFMRLPAGQRSTVILRDVLGYSLEEIGAMLETSLAATKAALHRGRTRLRDIAQEPDDTPLPVLAEAERSRLADYVARFNARDFDALRAMLAEDVQLELVNRFRRSGRREVQTYFGHYGEQRDWQFAAGLVDGRPAVIVRDALTTTAAPIYFVLLGWDGDRLIGIRDFRYARYAIEGAEVLLVE